MRDYKTPHCRFIILAAPRSGSNMLSSMLNSHPSVLCHHELYNPEGIHYALSLRDTEFSLAINQQQRDKDPLGFLARTWAHAQGMPCVGFKMTHKQNQQVFDYALNDPSIKKIVLHRNNQVKVHVSKLIAEKNGIWESYGLQEHAPTVRTLPIGNTSTQVTVELTKLEQDIAMNRAFYQEITDRLTQSKQPYLKLEYETLTQQDTLEKLFYFLAIAPHALTTRSQKQNPTDLKHNIDNFSALLRQVQDDELYRQLTDNIT
ncbi:hypothetical protein [Pseudoalteromonas sp. MMG005]|uniref:hypothetical protein n=1 Tax=Pseudoalteromonas sp. MMG005 TaxID=2822682 RepID=UPI001B3A6DF9|nr:hypothetical protein [Pseudoalteromonas sp. MMG005]MBQ4847718.1 hypothetical protein [Pseudoalteromonas sp. MMG005]